MSKQKHAVKKCGLFKIYPDMEQDTFKGKPIANSVMFMRMHGGKCTTTHKGKKVEIDISSVVGGSMTVLYVNGRTAVIDLEAFISAAIEAGLLDKKIDFTEQE